jgi:hypothetical protein
MALFTIGMLVTGCSTARRQDAYDAALARAFDDHASRTERAPSSLDGPEEEFQSLRGRTEVLVFPKVSNQASMTSEETIRGFSSPIRFSITSQRLLSCRKLLEEKTSKWAHREFFGKTVDPALDCGILELKQTAPEVKAGNRRNGDSLAARIYLDSRYQVHGIEFDIYRTRGESDTTRIKWDPQDASSSGLTLFPIDIPRLDSRSGSEGALPIPEDAYVRAKMKKFKAESCTTARTYQYRDLYGNRNTVGWCDGSAWPTVIDNSRFFAITVRK